MNPTRVDFEAVLRREEAVAEFALETGVLLVVLRLDMAVQVDFTRITDVTIFDFTFERPFPGVYQLVRF